MRENADAARAVKLETHFWWNQKIVWPRARTYETLPRSKTSYMLFISHRRKGERWLGEWEREIIIISVRRWFNLSSVSFRAQTRGYILMVLIWIVGHDRTFRVCGVRAKPQAVRETSATVSKLHPRQRSDSGSVPPPGIGPGHNFYQCIWNMPAVRSWLTERN